MTVADLRTTYSLVNARRVIAGPGSIDAIGEVASDHAAGKVLIVTDRGVRGAGLIERPRKALESAGIAVEVIDDTPPEPEGGDVERIFGLAKGLDARMVVGIGGGSAMDLAKAIAVLAANRGKAEDYLGLNRIPGPGLPKVMVPTTAGTGSEVTFTAVFIRKKLKKKEGMNSPYLYPELALLDPELTRSLPPHATATTGIDALCHAIESYTSVNASPMSEMVSLEAIGLISDNLRTAVHDGENLEAREAMLLGSLYAGLGLANAGVTAVHSLSYPLGGKYGVSHGLANTIMLPRVMAFNLPGAREKFVDIAETMGEKVDDLPIREAAYLAVAAVESLIEDCGVLTTLEELEIPEKDFPALAKAAMTVARPLANNPCRMTLEDMVEIYQECYS